MRCPRHGQNKVNENVHRVNFFIPNRNVIQDAFFISKKGNISVEN